jgi:hypothetical protein
MNKNKLKELVNALDELSDDVKDWDVTMESGEKPTCDTPGCHAGLISIVAQDLPELQDIHKKYRIGARVNPDYYNFNSWGNALAIFLGVVCRGNLERWAENNPKLWGNKFGRDMFNSWQAFTNDKNKWLTHRDIINHWKQVLVNIENEGVKV